ncbi:hypothetical protein KW794_02550, partial [Candidatus Saccharibacteria bacterium]|nr:hypothetical protein [Candidatus Saccharibacteria bacterium]
MSKGYNWAQLSFPTSTPTRATVSISAGNGNCAMSSLDVRKKTHRVTMPALAPGTKYFYCIKATPDKGKTLIARGNFVTDPPGPSDLQVRGGKLVLKSGPNYYPFIPVASTGYNCYPASSVNQLKALGVNLLLDAAGCIADPSTWGAALQPLLKDKLWLMETNYKYEAQMGDMPQLLRRSQTPLLSSYLLKGVPIGGQLYIGSCIPASMEGELNTYFLRMKRSADSQPIIFTVDISTPWANGRANCYDARSMEAQLFTPLIAGAQGFDIQTNTGSGNDVRTQIKDELVPAVQDFTRVLATFGPALRAGTTVAASSSPSLP